MPFAQVGDIDIYYERHGDGPALLNISGTGGDLRQMPASASPVTKHFDTLAYDQRGLGQTSKPDLDYTMADYADDAAALVEANAWDHCHVMGTSFGGMVALNLAVRHPNLIDRLVLCCTSPGGSHASYPLQTLGELDDREAFATRMRLIDNRWDPDADEHIPGLGAFGELIESQANETLSTKSDPGLAKQLAARADHDVVDQLDSLQHETLVCAGRFDDMAPVSNSELIVATMPNAALRVFDGGHIFMMQDRSAFETIITFLNDGAEAVDQ